MKRYGYNSTIEELKKGSFIKYYHWFSIYAGYKLEKFNEDGDEIIQGYLTFETFQKLYKNKIIDFSNTTYSGEIFLLNEKAV